jgi:hypothetical protein
LGDIFADQSDENRAIILSDGVELRLILRPEVCSGGLTIGRRLHDGCVRETALDMKPQKLWRTAKYTNLHGRSLLLLIVITKMKDSAVLPDLVHKKVGVSKLDGLAVG